MAKSALGMLSHLYNCVMLYKCHGKVIYVCVCVCVCIHCMCVSVFVWMDV